MKTRHTAIPAVFALMHQWKGLLFMRRSRAGSAEGLLGLPFGGVERGESLTRATVRMIRETVGISVNEAHLKLQHTRCCEMRDGGMGVEYFFHVSFMNGEKPWNVEPEKCSELVWIPPPYRNDDIVPHIKEVLSAIERQIPYSTEGFEHAPKVEADSRSPACM